MANTNMISEKSGSCALAVFIHGNKCYTANAGDSEGVICRKDNGKKNGMNIFGINKKMNANCKVEQERLRKMFPNESDIITSKVR